MTKIAVVVIVTLPVRRSSVIFVGTNSKRSVGGWLWTEVFFFMRKINRLFKINNCVPQVWDVYWALIVDLDLCSTKRNCGLNPFLAWQWSSAVPRARFITTTDTKHIIVQQRWSTDTLIVGLCSSGVSKVVICMCRNTKPFLRL